MADITHGTWIKDGKVVDAVYQDGVNVYSRNLVTDTTNELKTVTGSNWGSAPGNKASGIYGAGRYYASAYIENTANVGMTIYIRVNGHVGNFNGNTIPAGQSGIASCTVDILNGQSLESMWVGFVSPQTASYSYKYKEVMIKRTPSPWSPAPEDI